MREILRDMHHQMDVLHREIVALRQELLAGREPGAPALAPVPAPPPPKSSGPGLPTRPAAP